MRKTKRRLHTVVVGPHKITLGATSPQNAARKAFRLLIATGRLKSSPKQVEGEWKDVEIELL